MEQYSIPKKLDFKNLRLCLENYLAELIFIRDCGGYNPDGTYRCRGLKKVCENLDGKSLDFKKNKNGLHFLVDNVKIFNFPLKSYEKGFSLAYERIESTKGGIEKMILLSHGENPYDQNLPEPRRSILRNVLDSHLIEITFKGRVNLKFHSWWKEPDWKYWIVVK